jgi:hypothetical protein
MYLKFSKVICFGTMADEVVNSFIVLNAPENTHIIGENIMIPTRILNIKIISLVVLFLAFADFIPLPPYVS